WRRRRPARQRERGRRAVGGALRAQRRSAAPVRNRTTPAPVEPRCPALPGQTAIQPQTSPGAPDHNKPVAISYVMIARYAFIPLGIGFARGDAMQISLEGKKVAVAGGSRGIGRSIALAFAAAGADVAICARNAQGLAAAEVELKRHGRTVFSMPCDLGEASAAARFVAGAGAALGGIDILINNASGLGMKDDESGWLASINVDLMAAVRAAQAATPFME